MANNHYSQPYYGLPFAFPLQQPPQPAPAAQPSSQPASADTRHPLVPDAFPSLPGLNFTAYGQNTQQPQYSPTAWPPPPPDAWLPFMQNGMIPPPPLPGFGFPPPALPQMPQHTATPATLPPRPAAVANERVAEIVDSDKEDGEVSDREIVSQTPARNVNPRTQPEPPRSVPQTSRTLEEPYNPDRSAAGQKAPQQASAPNAMDTIQQSREAVKQFVKLLNSNNVGYRALANEIDDSQRDLLRSVYSSCNLASEPEPITLPKTNGEGQTPTATPVVQQSSGTQSQSQNSMSTKVAPTVKTSIHSAPPTKSAPSPVDRKDYIARLQAAKKAKQSGAAKPSPPQKTHPVATVKTPQPATTPIPKQPATDEQKARNTELIKQRLAAIKAGKKPTASASQGLVSSSSPAPGTEQTLGTFAQVSQASSNGLDTPNVQFQAPSFPGLPGLFMNVSSNQNNSQSIVPKPPLTVPQKRPVPSESTEVLTPRGSVAPFTRPLGESPHAHHNEQVIINIDDSEGSDMDIDDDQDVLRPAAASPLAQTRDANQTPGKSPNFPHRPASVQPASSTVSTPGPQTPATSARKDGIDKKEQELAALKVTLKKKLAEKREKDRAAAAAAATQSLHPSLPPKPPMPASAQNTSHAQSQPRTTEPAHSKPLQSESVSSSNTHSVDNSLGNTSQRRREQILLERSSYDAELASNLEQVARLTKEMEQLLARNEKLTKDKARLAEELENLGIDTEGMSHAELRAKKSEIEHARPPRSNAQSQDVTHISQPVTNRAEASTPVLPSAENFQSVSNTKKDATSSSTVAGQFALPGLGCAMFPVPTTANFQKSIAEETLIPEGANVTPPESRAADAQGISRSNEVHTRADMSQPSAGGITADSCRSVTPLDDDEDFYSPPPPADASAEAEKKHVQVPQAQIEDNVITAASPSEEGEVEMSVSTEQDEREKEEEEEEYEPEESVVVTDVVNRDVSIPESRTAQPSSSDDRLMEDEEFYEPPDADKEISDLPTNTAEAVADSNELEDEAEDGAMDIATSSSDESSDSDSDEGMSSGSEDNDSISASNGPLQNANIADDLAPELQPESVQTTSISEIEHADEDQVELKKFTPYESPLRMFKSYRYHPSYTQDVTGGFLSMTFSHQIDAEKPLCQYESAGGSCNDAECPDQHFRGMGITGEKLLVQLGTANPGKTPEEKQRWNDGLRGVLKELRQKNIKDPNGIAEEIAKYRREFLDDDTRVVNL